MSLISCFGHLVIGINDGIVGKGVGVAAAVDVGVGSGCCAVVLLLSTKSFSADEFGLGFSDGAMMMGVVGGGGAGAA